MPDGSHADGVSESIRLPLVVHPTAQDLYSAELRAVERSGTSGAAGGNQLGGRPGHRWSASRKPTLYRSSYLATGHPYLGSPD